MADASYIARDLRAEDVARVCSDWLKSYRREEKRVDNAVYFHNHHRAIQSLLADPTAAWLVLCPADKPSLVLGWLCAQKFANGAWLLHYLYVAQTYRRLGFASRLLATAGVPKNVGVMATHTTGQGRLMLRARGNEMTYNPYLFAGRLHVPVQLGRKFVDLKKAGAKSESAIADSVQMQVKQTGKETA